MKCPECGKEMKTCCQLYQEYVEQYPDRLPTLGHSCGQSEWICECGYREYVYGSFLVTPYLDLGEYQLEH